MHPNLTEQALPSIADKISTRENAGYTQKATSKKKYMQKEWVKKKETAKSPW